MLLNPRKRRVTRGTNCTIWSAYALVSVRCNEQINNPVR